MSNSVGTTGSTSDAGTGIPPPMKKCFGVTWSVVPGTVASRAHCAAALIARHLRNIIDGPRFTRLYERRIHTLQAASPTRKRSNTVAAIVRFMLGLPEMTFAVLKQQQVAVMQFLYSKQELFGPVIISYQHHFTKIF